MANNMFHDVEDAEVSIDDIGAFSHSCSCGTFATARRRRQQLDNGTAAASAWQQLGQGLGVSVLLSGGGM
jgi:hypothetical protein